jgi:hypothetical protein
MIANYSAWNHERGKWEVEASKNKKPDIRGTATNFREAGAYGDGRIGGTIFSAFGIKFDLILCNHRPITTNLQNVMICGPLFSKVADFSEIKFEFGRTLDYGIVVTIPVSARVSINHISMSDLKGEEIGLSKLEMEVVDGFGDRHRVAVAEDEKLWFL